MFPSLLLGSWLVLAIRASTCPAGYTVADDGSCYGGPYFSIDRNSAYYYCSQHGAYLYDVQNGFQNSDVVKKAGKSDAVWLGLTCLSNTTTSCMWDTGVSLGNTSYTNFMIGGFDVTKGACVAMQVSTGLWFSTDCSSYQAVYGCKYTDGVSVPRCVSSGMKTATFRNRCYYTVNASSLADASNTCKQGCGNVASIHSDGENNFIQNLASSMSATAYMFTGLKKSTSYIWQDGSSYDYSNFGLENPQLGPCVSMALADGFVKSGKWINSQCEGQLVAVCIKEVQNTCDATTLPPITTPAPTMVPPTCGDPTAYSGAGMLYSPGYPKMSTPNHCEYLISEDAQQQPFIKFTDGHLDSDSYIYLYNGLFATSPFKTLTNRNLANDLTLSSTNVIRMVYNTTGTASSQNFWSAQYSF